MGSLITKGRIIAAVIIVALMFGGLVGYSPITEAANHKHCFGTSRIAAVDMENDSNGSFLALSRTCRDTDGFDEFATVLLGGELAPEAYVRPVGDDVREYNVATKDLGGLDRLSAAADTAWVVAHTVARLDRVPSEHMVHVEQIYSEHPVLEFEDRIIAVDGSPVGVYGMNVRIEKGAETLTVARGTSTFEVNVSDVDFDGVSVVTAARLHDPRPAVIVRPGTRGPSSGLAHTLTFIDALTEGDLTGGLTVAVTGGINPDGSVRPMGHITEKTWAALAADADVLFMPEGRNFDEAVEVSDGQIEVIAVSTAYDVVRWLCAHGGTSEGACDWF